MNSQEIIGQIAEAVLNNRRFLVPAATAVSSEQRNYVDERGKIKESYWQFVEAGKKLDPVAVSHPSENSKNHPPTLVSK